MGAWKHWLRNRVALRQMLERLCAGWRAGLSGDGKGPGAELSTNRLCFPLCFLTAVCVRWGPGIYLVWVW